jgi:hypothetical protein
MLILAIYVAAAVVVQVRQVVEVLQVVKVELRALEVKE